jgi:hypothetical protein
MKTFRILHQAERDRGLQHLYIVSPTFYEQFLCRYYFAKKLQSKTVTREKLCKNHFVQKAARKMLVKSTLD